MEFLFPFIFPWHLGAGLYEVLPLIQIADLFGVWGLTALVVLVNYAAWDTLRFLRRRRPLPVSSLATAALLACEPEASSLRLTCDPDPTNATRAFCNVSVDPPAEVTLSWGPEDDPERHTRTLPAGSGDRVPVLGLVPEERHTVTATSQGAADVARFTTLPLPFTLTHEVTGTSSAPSARSFLKSLRSFLRRASLRKGKS